jgi:hypothetical protein
MVSSMIVWVAWFVTVYALIGTGCRAGWNTVGLPVGNLLSLLMLLATLVALGLMGWCAQRGYVAWRGTGPAGAAPGREITQRQRFLGLAMFLLALLAGIGTLLGAIPILMLDPCAA